MAAARWYEPAASLLRLIVPQPCLGLTPYDSPRFSAFLAAAAAVPASMRTLLLRGVVSASGELVAVADWRVLGRVLFLNGIAVAHSHRGGGLGTELVADGVRLAKSLGCSAAELDVAVGNDPAAALYERAEFEPVGVTTWVELSGEALAPPAAAGGSVLVAPAPARTATTWRVRNWPMFSAHFTAYGFGDVDLAGPGQSAAVRVLPSGWRLSGLEETAAAPAAVDALAAVLGERPAKAFVVGTTEESGVPIVSFRRLRRLV
ncbi:GNAT family N-acetyltransferase [Tenggerimyces flavus]|uniref:GNAT family N-acetyltransferase n=1 Tax=Tenggerimyces flavus TaxID=1708749 RepID=A0ABV7YAX4_9ACTN|nr:GNAT family N-acetyltransferase [Tenggerimyces flavus]MBM7783813.1 GNAT superfamily N-acetyltransferase [Tenggerimyces flavus]